MDAPLTVQLEAATLATWAECSPAIDVGEHYDELREALSRYQADYQAARRRGRAGWADADKAVAEMVAVIALLDVIADALAWRRQVYAARGRPWPLTSP